MLDDQFKQQERQKDRDNQAEVLRRLCSFKGPSWSFEQTRTGSIFDAFIFNLGEKRAITEVKCRTCTFAAYLDAGYRIDTRKIEHLLRDGRMHGVPAVLAVRWKCGTHGYVNLTDATDNGRRSFPSQLVKRHDRDELPDMQSDIPMNLFVKF